MKRTVALGAAWTASAAAAVGLGFLAVSFVDASASPGTQPVAASTTSSTSSSTSSSSASPSSASPSSASGTPGPLPSTSSPTTAPQMSPGEYVTAGGTVYAHCTSGSPVVAGVPAAGFWVDDSNDPGKIEFESDGPEVEVRVSCDGNVPVFRLDDSGGNSGSGNSGHGGSDDSRDDSSGHGGSDDD